MPKPLEPMVKLARENERLKIDNANLRALNKKVLRRGGGFDQFIDELKEVLALDNTFTYKVRPRYKQAFEPVNKDHEEIVCAPTSDLHLAEEVRLEDSNGINVYGPMIAANRLWEHSQQIKAITEQRKFLHTVAMIWSPILGDMVNGTIHTEQIYTNSLTDPASVILCGRLLYMFYTEMKSIGLPIEIDAIHGNHPRMTVKMPTKRQAHTNLDWLIYENLADRFSKDDQIKMKVWTSQIGMRKLYDWRYLFEHGIDVKNGKEEDFESRLRALFDDPVYRNATGLQGASFDQALIGNLHKEKFLQRSIVNGSYVGQNELGQSWRLKPIRAAQLMWGVSKTQVRTWMHGVDLTHIRHARVTNPFSEYTKWFMDKHGK